MFPHPIRIQVLPQRFRDYSKPYDPILLLGEGIKASIFREGSGFLGLHPGRLTWNLRIHPWKRKIIFQTIIFMFYVNLPGCNSFLVIWSNLPRNT